MKSMVGVRIRIQNKTKNEIAMPPSPVPSSVLAAAEEQTDKAAVEQQTTTTTSDQAEPIVVDEEEEEEEEGGAAGDAATDDDDEATAAASGDKEDQTLTAVDFDLPRSILRRIVKAHLSEVTAQELGPGKEFGVSKEALEALGEGAKVITEEEEVEFFFFFFFFSVSPSFFLAHALISTLSTLQPGLHLVHHVHCQRPVQGREETGENQRRERESERERGRKLSEISIDCRFRSSLPLTSSSSSTLNQQRHPKTFSFRQSPPTTWSTPSPTRASRRSQPR